MKGSIREAAGEAFVAALTARMRTLAEELVEQLRSGVAELGELEAVALKSATRLGNELLSGLCGRRGPLYAPSEVECSGGGMAAEREMRTVPTKTR